MTSKVLKHELFDNPAVMQSAQTILFATDGTSYAETAFVNTIHTLKHSGGRLVITYFADPNDTVLFDGFPCRSAEEWQAYGRNVLERLAKKARDAGIEQVETILEHYQGEEQLSELAQQVHADVIVLASHLFQGSYSG